MILFVRFQNFVRDWQIGPSCGHCALTSEVSFYVVERLERIVAGWLATRVELAYKEGSYLHRGSITDTTLSPQLERNASRSVSLTLTSILPLCIVILHSSPLSPCLACCSGNYFVGFEIYIEKKKK